MNFLGWILKSQVVLLQTAHYWANAGVLLGARMHRERVAFETINSVTNHHIVSAVCIAPI